MTDLQTETERLNALRAAGKEAILYGKSITWTDLGGTVSTISVDLFESQSETEERAIALAIKQGWTHPRLWQWWRWNDTRP